MSSAQRDIAPRPPVGPGSRSGRMGVLASIALLLLVGCERSPSERCEELRSSVDAKAAELPAACTVDLDCFVVEVRPSWYVAVSATPDDAELAAAVDAMRAECEQPEPLPNVFGAGCFEFSGETNGKVEAVKRCALTYGGTPIDLATTDVASLDLDPCNCATHEDCAPTELCQGNCQCRPRCEAGCGQADACGPETLPSFGMGSDYATCVDVCEVNLFDETLQSQLRCVSTAACETLEGCFL